MAHRWCGIRAMGRDHFYGERTISNRNYALHIRHVSGIFRLTQDGANRGREREKVTFMIHYSN